MGGAVKIMQMGFQQKDLVDQKASQRLVTRIVIACMFSVHPDFKIPMAFFWRGWTFLLCIHRRDRWQQMPMSL